MNRNFIEWGKVNLGGVLVSWAFVLMITGCIAGQIVWDSLLTGCTTSGAIMPDNTNVVVPDDVKGTLIRIVISGSTYYFESIDPTLLTRPVGTHVRVRYEPTDPTNARVDDFADLYGVGAFFGLLGYPVLLPWAVLFTREYARRVRTMGNAPKL